MDYGQMFGRLRQFSPQGQRMGQHPNMPWGGGGVVNPMMLQQAQPFYRGTPGGIANVPPSMQPMPQAQSQSPINNLPVNGGNSGGPSMSGGGYNPVFGKRFY